MKRAVPGRGRLSVYTGMRVGRTWIISGREGIPRSEEPPATGFNGSSVRNRCPARGYR